MAAPIVAGGSAVFVRRVVCPLAAAVLSSVIGRRINLLELQPDGRLRRDMSLLKLVACEVSKVALATISAFAAIFPIVDQFPRISSFWTGVGVSVPFVGSPSLGAGLEFLANFSLLYAGGLTAIGLIYNIYRSSADRNPIRALGAELERQNAERIARDERYFRELGDLARQTQETHARAQRLRPMTSEARTRLAGLQAERQEAEARRAARRAARPTAAAAAAAEDEIGSALDNAIQRVRPQHQTALAGRAIEAVAVGGGEGAAALATPVASLVPSPAAAVAGLLGVGDNAELQHFRQEVLANRTQHNDHLSTIRGIEVEARAAAAIASGGDPTIARLDAAVALDEEVFARMQTLLNRQTAAPSAQAAGSAAAALDPAASAASVASEALAASTSASAISAASAPARDDGVAAAQAAAPAAAAAAAADNSPSNSIQRLSDHLESEASRARNDLMRMMTYSMTQLDRTDTFLAKQGEEMGVDLAKLAADDARIDALLSSAAAAAAPAVGGGAAASIDEMLRGVKMLKEKADVGLTRNNTTHDQVQSCYRIVVEELNRAAAAAAAAPSIAAAAAGTTDGAAAS